MSDYLVRAADLIRRHGWVQRKDGSRGSGFCLVGALVYVHSFGGGDVETYHEAFDALSRVVGTRNIAAWNDTEGRSREDVLTALETAFRSHSVT